MTEFTLSAVLICPAALRDKANALACALGHDELPGSTFSVPLSADGGEPATHFGCRAVAQPSFAQTLQDAAGGTLPPVPWTDFDLTEDEVWQVLAALIADFLPAQQSEGHFDAVLQANGLRRPNPPLI